jgi:hypothetical protein
MLTGGVSIVSLRLKLSEDELPCLRLPVPLPGLQIYSWCLRRRRVVVVRGEILGWSD